MRTIFLVPVCLALAAGCGRRAATSVEIDPALARLVPSDTTALVDVKVDAVRATPLYQKYIASQIASFKAAQDASEVLAVFNGKDGVVFAMRSRAFSGMTGTGRSLKPPEPAGACPLS